MRRVFINVCMGFLMITLFSGCATTEGRWKKAESLNTIEAYEEFLTKYPQGKFANEARTKIEELYFKRAIATNTVAGYEEFLKRYPQGKYVNEAHSRIEELYFERAKATNTIEGYEGFIKRYPQGEHAEKARLQIEELYFERAKAQNTIQGYEEFLGRYPQGKFAAEVRLQLEELYFEQAEATNTLKGYEEFLRRYPKGKFTDKVQEMMKIYHYKPEDSDFAILGMLGGIGSIDLQVTEKIDHSLEIKSLSDTSKIAATIDNRGRAKYMPDALDSRNIKVVVNKKLGYTTLAGLKFKQNATVNIWKDGTIEVDREGIEAEDKGRNKFVSKKVTLKGKVAFVMMQTN